MSNHRPWPTLSEPGTVLRITPEDAGWAWTGLHVAELTTGSWWMGWTGDTEVLVIPLAGSVVVEVRAGEADDDDAPPEASFTLDGRRSVFTGPTDVAYVGRDSRLNLRLVGESATVALASSAVVGDRRPPRYVPVEDVPVETRGAGAATRQVHNFCVPGVFDHPEKLIVCELITPPGNWSSYPPHKHDASEPCPVVNEEIYYFRIAGQDQVTPDRAGFGLHRTYTGPEHDKAGLAPIDDYFEVRDHDVVLVPHGYHGPCVAAPGYPMYYLNVMAGPGTRAMAFCDDPEHGWVRDSWTGMDTDPRIPWRQA